MDQEVFQQLLLDNADDIIQDLELDCSIRCPDCIINDTEFGDCYQDGSGCEYINDHIQIIEKILEWSANKGFELFQKYNSIFNPDGIYIKNPYNWLMEYVLLETRKYRSSVSPKIFDQVIERLRPGKDCTRFLTYTDNPYFLEKLIQAGIDVNEPISYCH